MRNWVNEWVQEGSLYVWRYADPGRGWRGWHFTADPAGCRSVRNLLDRMHAGEQCHRTLKLEPVTDAILSVPNYGHKADGRFDKLRIEYLPGFDGLRMAPDGTALTMTISDRRLRQLSSAFSEVEVGMGDFGVATSNEKRAERWMFWWMLNINYQDGKQS
jgi:hypothetical protein